MCVNHMILSTAVPNPVMTTDLKAFKLTDPPPLPPLPPEMLNQLY